MNGLCEAMTRLLTLRWAHGQGKGNDKKERKAWHSIIEEHLKEHSEARRATPRPATTQHNKKEQKSVGFNTGPEGARCGEQQRKRQE
jgi:hypothetical protein